MTPSLDEMEQRHRKVEAEVGPYCNHCEHDWPCDAAVLIAERRKLIEALADVMDAFDRPSLRIGPAIDAARAVLGEEAPQ